MTDIPVHIMKALKDDLNTPLVIKYMHELADIAFKTVGEERIKAAKQLKAVGNFLGILNHDPKVWFQGSGDNKSIDDLVAARYEAKKAKNFAEADRIRTLLIEQGITLEDGPEKTTWRRSNRGGI